MPFKPTTIPNKNFTRKKNSHNLPRSFHITKRIEAPNLVSSINMEISPIRQRMRHQRPPCIIP